MWTAKYCRNSLQKVVCTFHPFQSCTIATFAYYKFKTTTATTSRKATFFQPEHSGDWYDLLLLPQRSIAAGLWLFIELQGIKTSKSAVARPLTLAKNAPSNFARPHPRSAARERNNSESMKYAATDSTGRQLLRKLGPRSAAYCNCTWQSLAFNSRYGYPS